MTQQPQAQTRPSAYPPDITYMDLIAKNKRNSVIMIIGMFIMTILTIIAGGFILAYFLVGGFDPVMIIPILILSTIIGTVTGVIWFLISYYKGGDALMYFAGAQQIDKAQDPQLFNVVEEMAIAAGLPLPKIYIIPTDALNAFATGRDPDNAAVAITTGLRQRLPREELQAVMAHEVAHIRHYDIRLNMLVATMVGLIIMISDVAKRVLFYGTLFGGGRRRSSDRSGGGGGVIMLVIFAIAIIFIILAPIMAVIIQYAISRQREYLADAGAVELTRNPQGLINALSRLAADSEPVPNVCKATAHMYVKNPLCKVEQQNLNSAFSTHPPMNTRIERIMALLR